MLKLKRKSILSLILLSAAFTPSTAFASLGGARLNNCGNGTAASNILGAYAVLGRELTQNYGKFKQCIDNAYLVNHDRHSAHKIARRFTTAKVTDVTCKKLTGANGEAPLKISKQRMNIDQNFARTSSPRRLASVIAHELAHNFGYGHPSPNDYGSTLYANTVPEQVENCILNGKPNAYKGPGRSYYSARNVIGVGLDGDKNYVFVFSKDGTVTAGSTTKTHLYRTPRRVRYPRGKTASDVVGMAIDGDKDAIYAWYRDGTVSAGTSVNLEKFRKPYRYSLPKGKSPNDIVGMALDGDINAIYAWYRDGTVSSGSTSDLDSKRRPYRYSLPAGKSPSDIIAMAQDGDNNYVYAWYKDGTVSAGTSDNLSVRREKARVGTGR